MILTSAFQDAGSPATGLSPAITVYDLSDNSVVVNAQAMSEVANGIYKYDFAGYDKTTDYAIYVDGGATLDDVDRYQYGSNEEEMWGTTRARIVEAVAGGQYNFAKATSIETIKDDGGNVLLTRTVTDTTAEVNKQ